MAHTAHDIELLDVVALTCDLPDRNLARGQVGTVVEVLAPGVFEVEFSDDEGKTYADRLAAAGVPVEYRCFGGMIHAFLSFAAAIPAADEAVAFIAERLRTALHS